jgi:death on curing protein
VEASGRPLIYPTRAQVVALNQKLLARFGGKIVSGDNVINEDGLVGVLHTLQHPFVFGENQYPTIAHLAGLLAWRIIDGHLFGDGNKRTGMSAMLVFLLVNGFLLFATDVELEAIALQIADKTNTGYTYEAFVEWLSERIV